MVNSLTRSAGVRLGPLLLETLVKHYFERVAHDNASQGRVMTKLRQDELLYDEAFIVVKTFLEASTKHTVEELQKFSNTRTPAPPWVQVVRLLVPMSCCDEAAQIVVRALGGEEQTKHLVGGTKWWQVRGLRGVDAEWIVARKDWQEAKRRHQAHEKERAGTNEQHKDGSSTDSPQAGASEDGPPRYQPEMDEMRCILFAHGGGYYFGSIDQERYAIQRYARKINGRVFAINYRLAPQYPFPCALQDLIAAYLFLIRPPEGASHRPVRPEHIVVAGDSAGGGLTIALLQVIRDCGLPPPAGGVLISPWCDLTHSFPSIHTNTATDVIPPYGLSFYKPSTLWPPPPDDLTSTVRETLRSRIRHAVSLSAPTGSKGRGHNRSESRSRPVTPLEGGHDLRLPRTGQTLRLGSTASLPTIQAGIRDQTVSCSTASGETLTIHEQIHLYTPNYMLHHPLISPVVSYLGGLPPLLIIAGDAEVLRDEIVYFAHKAANPDKYPVKQEARDMYPALEGIEKRFAPTSVHLQVYDDAAHILPILFSFTTPAKYCFRAIATFIRFVTGTLPASVSDPVEITSLPITQSPPSTPGGFSGTSVSQGSNERLPRPSSLPRTQSSPASREASPRPRRASLFIRANKNKVPDEENGPAAPTAHRKSFRRAISSHISRTGLFRNQSVSETAPENVEPEINGGQISSGSATPPQEDSADVGGPRFHGYDWSQNDGVDVRRAGEPSAYQNGIVTMIRERISTHGVIRPLEPESELSAFSLPPEIMGQVSELAMRRYQDARLKFDKKFSGTYKTIEKHRRKNIETAKKDAVRNMTQLQNYIAQDEKPSDETFKGVKDGLFAGGSWSWAWALDTDERPPPSSIVARRDTHEAVELARIADQAVLVEENMMSGNNLWSLMVNFLTVSPDKHHQSHHLPPPQDRESKRERIRSRFAHLVSELKKKPVPSEDREH